MLESNGSADPDTLAALWREAGETGPAAEYALAAANDAAKALAFDRDANLYRVALELRPALADERNLHIKLGDALAHGGRGGEAADAYLAAARRAENADGAAELKRRAAEQLLRSGHIDRGRAVVRDVLTAVGLPYPASPRAALSSLLVHRLRIRLRGLRHRERDASELPADAIMRADACWSMSTGLAMVDSIRAAEAQCRHLLLALSLGEPYRVARGIAAEAAFVATAGARAHARAERLCVLAEQLAHATGNPHALGLARLAATLTAFSVGAWREVVRNAKPAIALFRNRCAGAHWELVTTRHWLLWALVYLGELHELPHRIPAALREADERGDIYTATNLRSGLLNQRWLLEGDLAAARSQLELAVEQWVPEGFDLQGYNALLARANLQIYADQGPGADAIALVETRWRELAGSLLMRIEQIRIEALALRARAHLAAAAAARDRHHRRAASLARRLFRERSSWATPLAELVAAGVACRGGDAAASIAHLGAAERAAEDCHMPLHAAAARRQRGLLVGGDEGAAAAREAERAIAARGVAEPGRWAAMLAPGFG
jgi:hypothetical protein